MLGCWMARFPGKASRRWTSIAVPSNGEKWAVTRSGSDAPGEQPGRWCYVLTTSMAHEVGPALRCGPGGPKPGRRAVTLEFGHQHRYGATARTECGPYLSPKKTGGLLSQAARNQTQGGEVR